MFNPITLPFGARMLFNTVTLKPGVKFEDVELAVGEMCNVVKETYGGDKGGRGVKSPFDRFAPGGRAGAASGSQ